MCRRADDFCRRAVAEVLNSASIAERANIVGRFPVYYAGIWRDARRCRFIRNGAGARMVTQVQSRAAMRLACAAPVIVTPCARLRLSSYFAQQRYRCRPKPFCAITSKRVPLRLWRQMPSANQALIAGAVMILWATRRFIYSPRKTRAPPISDFAAYFKRTCRCRGSACRFAPGRRLATMS